MSHIQVELKVIEVHAPAVARTMGEPVALTIGGLTLLWHRCWSTKTSTITRIGLGGVFGMDRLDLRIEAMIDAGFLEADADVFRVCGAGKYLRIREGNSKGGKAASGNLKRGGNKPGMSREGAGGGAGDKPGEVPGSLPALTPSTEHRAPNTEHRKAAAGPLSLATPEGFWTACQDKRDAIPGMVRETPPARLDHWFSEAMMQVNGDEQRLLAGYEQFLVDPFWRNEATRRCHWGGWVKQWRDFVSRAASPVTTKSSTKAPVAAESVDWSTVTPGEVAL